MKLFYREIGQGDPLIILHGLWGASENWLPIARLLEDRFRVILPDVRNHGQSPHSNEMDYDVMSDDIIELIESLQLPVRPCIAGHSMGGKIVMAILMKKPELIRKAVVVDIAPIAYTSSDGGRHSKIIDFMSAFNLRAYQTREEIKNAIESRFKTPQSQQLFLKNIRKTENGFEWKINHESIQKHFQEISGCPSRLPLSQYTREILFIKGEHSDLIPTDKTFLYEQFPAARFIQIPDCGHWIHSEQPEKLAQAIKTFILPKQKLSSHS
ncbi:alpha/beta fold hydrolase [Gabonibacter massiliensis]|uniref:alpha/beta fold hydrolase n=1 Tax=Gabonibacter massiliensis TaxID=1720195 RepID=UPI00073F1DD1|nr:alpha/beta fold hydrolase [Gabonibacter massiliensis]